MEESRKRKRSFKNCTKEKKKEKGSPSYENESSLYAKEISLKIEEFKLARSNWVASKKEDEIIKTNSEEGLNESGAYRGRFNSLKKIGLNSLRLRKHYQTVKPLRYFTLKPKVSDTDTSKSKQEKQRDRPLIEQDSFEEDTMLRDKKQRIWDEKETEIKKLVGEALGGKVTEKEKKKKKRKGPSKKAIENLKASKRSGRFLESCKCNDGKEVTVVIKGFCLCDKGNLNTLKLNKINDDVKKLEKFKPDVEKEEVQPHLVDSIEFHKKQIERKSKILKEEKEEEEKQQDGMVQSSKSGKSVSFEPSIISRKIDNEWKSEKNDEKRDQEEKREMKGYDKEQKKKKKEEELVQEEIRKKHKEEKKPEEEMRKKQEEMIKNREDEEKQQEEIRKEQEEIKKEQVKKEGEERTKEQEQKMVQQEQKSCKKKEAEPKKWKEDKDKFHNTPGDGESIVTLFQNKSPVRSKMALTEEQFEKMKKISE